MSTRDRRDDRARLGAATRRALLAGAACACIVVIFGPGVPTAEPAAAPGKPAPLAALSKRAGVAEEALRASLWEQSSEVVLDKKPKVAGGGRQLIVESPVPEVKDREAPLTAGIRAFVAKRADLRGLPLAAEKDCQLSREAVAVLTRIGQFARELQVARDFWAGQPAGPGSRLAEVNRELTDFLTDARKKYAKEPLAASPLRQLFEVETLPLRTELAATLRALPGQEATRSLARLAAFDLSPSVRKAAIKALKGRPAKDARPVFLAALRHVWAPAADHAAYALVELDDRAAVPDLEELLDEPAPGAGRKEGGKWVRRELVRVNHLRNCFLCHPAADGATENGALFAPVPVPDRRLPSEGYQGRSQPGTIRADVVYFRPDFSATHKVEKAAPWPEVQRFDYLVRTRELTKSEVDELPAAPAGAGRDYPQRRAVKGALAGLKERKAGAKE